MNPVLPVFRFTHLFKWFGSLMVAAAATADGRSNMLLVDINAHGSVHNHTSLMRGERDRGKAIKCDFTIDNIVSSVYYGDKDISKQVKGSFKDWKKTKTVTFTDAAMPLTIAGYNADRGDSGHCKTGGFAVVCTNGVKSGTDAGWMAYDSTKAIDNDHKKGEGTGWRMPGKSTAAFHLPSRKDTPKICGGSGRKYVAFRWTPAGFTAGVCKVTLYAGYLGNGTGCEVMCPADKEWSGCTNLASTKCGNIDNNISGIAVFGKASVKLCHDPNCRGICKAYTSTTGAQPLLSAGDNDKFSSVMIRRTA